MMAAANRNGTVITPAGLEIPAGTADQFTAGLSRRMKFGCACHVSAMRSSSVSCDSEEACDLASQVVGTGQQLLDRQVLTGVWRAADGAFQAPESRVIIVPTGTERLTELGTPESTCNDWTDPAGTKTFGAYAFANRHWWFRDRNRTCDEPVALYCVEE